MIKHFYIIIITSTIVVTIEWLALIITLKPKHSCESVKEEAFMSFNH